jgi:hypothetical protein
LRYQSLKCRIRIAQFGLGARDEIVVRHQGAAETAGQGFEPAWDVAAAMMARRLTAFLIYTTRRRSIVSTIV